LIVGRSGTRGAAVSLQARFVFAIGRFSIVAVLSTVKHIIVWDGFEAGEWPMVSEELELEGDGCAGLQ
jgi:hypothetical protein